MQSRKFKKFLNIKITLIQDNLFKIINKANKEKKENN